MANPQVFSSDFLAVQANPAFKASRGTQLPDLVMQRLATGTPWAAGARIPITPRCPEGTVYVKPPPMTNAGAALVAARRTEATRALFRTFPGKQPAIDRIGMVPMPGKNAVARVPFGIAGLGEEVLPGAESIRLGAAITRQVTAMQNIQQGLYAALNDLEPGRIRKLFGADAVPQYLRGQVDAWNQQVNRWWDSGFTTRASQNIAALKEWTDLGDSLIKDAGVIATTLDAQALGTKIAAFASAFRKEMGESIQHAIQFVGQTGASVVTAGGNILNAGAKSVANVFGTLSWGVIVPVVGALGAVALGFYMLKRAGVKADVAIPGVPVRAGLSSLHSRRRRRRLHA